MIFSLIAWLERTLVKVPFRDSAGDKGRWERFTRAPRHRLRQVTITHPGWPRFEMPLKVVFLSDFHVGSHSGDVRRLASLVDEAGALGPHLICLGGDYMNMMPFGNGRVPPETIAPILGRLKAPLGCFAILGNHDADYGAELVTRALRGAGIVVLEDDGRALVYAGSPIHVAGLSSDLRASDIVARLPAGDPAIIIAHDPAAFRHMPSGPYVMLCGHTHGGQVCLPFFGPLINRSEAPLRWTYGHVVEGGKHMYVTSGIGTSGFPIRIGAAPEIVALEIRGAAGTSPRR